MHTPLLGIVGGIGCGKSFVADLFAELGGRVIDADQLGHLALREPAIRTQIVAEWGDGLLDSAGEVDRGRLGSIVFRDPAARQRLESLVFPWIHQQILQQIATARSEPAVRGVILDAAVLLESGWQGKLDALVFVEAPEDIRKQRVEARGWTEAEWRRREAAQLPLEAKRQQADYVIDNSGNLEETRRQVEFVWRQVTQDPSKSIGS